jgi:SAM-dependent methyltransferase
MDKPFCEACERNKAPILEVLRPLYADRRRVLEIGSGTGQHAVFFAAALPHLRWQCSELAPNLPGLRPWLDEAALPNLPPPLALDAGDALPIDDCDAVFTANTLHIMAWPQVQQLFAGLGRWLPPGALFTVYGPFNYGGRFTSDSNARFDAALRSADPVRGIRDFEAIDALARAAGLELRADQAMPANNRCLTWQRVGQGTAALR